jgi:hypothetical protein
MPASLSSQSTRITLSCQRALTTCVSLRAKHGAQAEGYGADPYHSHWNSPHAIEKRQNAEAFSYRARPGAGKYGWYKYDDNLRMVLLAFCSWVVGALFSDYLPACDSKPARLSPMGKDSNAGS